MKATDDEQEFSPERLAASAGGYTRCPDKLQGKVAGAIPSAGWPALNPGHTISPAKRGKPIPGHDISPSKKCKLDFGASFRPRNGANRFPGTIFRPRKSADWISERHFAREKVQTDFRGVISPTKWYERGQGTSFRPRNETGRQSF